MIINTLNDLSKMFSKMDLKNIVVYKSEENTMKVSSHTDDKQVYLYAESKENNWKYNEFAFRDWTSISSIISTFINSNNDTTCNVLIETDKDNYPTLMKFRSDNIYMTYYLQNYTFLSRQDDLYNVYKGKKFQLSSVLENQLTDFTNNTMLLINKLSSILNEKYFRIKLENNMLYFCFGDETKTMDNGKICVSKNYTYPLKNKDLLFSVDYLFNAYSALKDQNIKIKFDGATLLLSGENEISKKVIAIIGKNE